MIPKIQRCCVAFGAALTFFGPPAQAEMPVCDDTYGKVAVSFTPSSGPRNMNFGPEGSCEERIKSELLKYRGLGQFVIPVSCFSSDRQQGGEKVDAGVYERKLECFGVPVGQVMQVTCDERGRRPFSFFY